MIARPLNQISPTHRALKSAIACSRLEILAKLLCRKWEPFALGNGGWLQVAVGRLRARQLR
jgi:hypothetical protein